MLIVLDFFETRNQSFSRYPYFTIKETKLWFVGGGHSLNTITLGGGCRQINIGPPCVL